MLTKGFWPPDLASVGAMDEMLAGGSSRPALRGRFPKLGLLRIERRILGGIVDHGGKRQEEPAAAVHAERQGHTCGEVHPGKEGREVALHVSLRRNDDGGRAELGRRGSDQPKGGRGRSGMRV